MEGEGCEAVPAAREVALAVMGAEGAVGWAAAARATEAWVGSAVAMEAAEATMGEGGAAGERGD